MTPLGKRAKARGGIHNSNIFLSGIFMAVLRFPTRKAVPRMAAAFWGRLAAVVFGSFSWQVTCLMRSSSQGFMLQRYNSKLLLCTGGKLYSHVLFSCLSISSRLES